MTRPYLEAGVSTPKSRAPISTKLLIIDFLAPLACVYVLTYIIADINYVIMRNPQDTALIKSVCDDHIIFDNY